MLRITVLSLVLVGAGALFSSNAAADQIIVHPGGHSGFVPAGKHHFIPPGHRRHGDRITRFGYIHRAPPVRIVRRSSVVIGHRHYRGCGHYGYRPGYYTRYSNYYSNRYYGFPDFRRAGRPWHHERFGFFIFYED